MDVVESNKVAETILLLSLSPFPVPQNHEILEEVFFWQLKEL